jgi:hypothetical protein
VIAFILRPFAVYDPRFRGGAVLAAPLKAVILGGDSRYVRGTSSDRNVFISDGLFLSRSRHDRHDDIGFRLPALPSNLRDLKTFVANVQRHFERRLILGLGCFRWSKGASSRN